MRKRHYQRSNRRAIAFALLMISVVSISLLVFQIGSQPAYADAPWKPGGGYTIINCSSQASSIPCSRINSAPTCESNDSGCFARFDNAQSLSAWWLNRENGSICSGTDVNCLDTYGISMWTFDHTGDSPQVRSDEEVPVATPPALGGSVGQTTTPPVAGTNPDGSCLTINEFCTQNITQLSNGLEFCALLVCMAGIFFSAILWAVGSKGQNPGQELTGKRGLIVCLVAAFAIGAIPGMALYLNHEGAKADANGGVTNVTNPHG